MIVMDCPTVSVVIATRNRRHDVLVAVQSALAQDYPHLEVLVYDDNSSDGTVAAIEERWPEAKVHGSSEPASPTVLRNRGFREATGELVLSLDDDSYFSAPTIISDIVRDFAASPHVAVVGVPFIEPFATASHQKIAVAHGEPISAF